MRYLMLVVFVIFICFPGITQKKLVIIGSSTSACYNLPYNDCYVGKLNLFFNQASPFDTIIDNHLALGGSTCFAGMPSSSTSPYDAYQPDTARNITKALTLNPDVILVNFPTNGYDIFRTDSILYCLRTIRDSANKKGVPCFVTTTQPRTSGNFFSHEMRRKMAELKDSILLEFGSFAVDFWTGLITSDTAILYDQGDHTHMTAIGHTILAQRVETANIFLAALPATFLQFNTIYKNNTDIISWQTARETDVANYEIQRSGDGRSFVKIATVGANNNFGNNQYQFIDEQPLKGWNYYKILIADRDGKKHASAIMSVYLNAGKLAIVKAFAHSAVQVIVELQNNEPQNAEIQLLNNMGMLISKTSRRIEAGSTTIYLNTPSLGNGVYHVKLVTPKETTVSSFMKVD